MGYGPDYTISRPDASASGDLHTSVTSIPSVAPGTFPDAYSLVFIIKAKLPLVDTGIRGFTKKLPIRLRLSTTSGLGPNSLSLADPIPDGEVEDHIVTFTSSFDSPYPRITDTISSSALLWSYLIDKNSTNHFQGGGHFNGVQSPSSDDEWHLDYGIILQGRNPIVPPYLLANFPNGKVPYFHTARFTSGGVSAGIHWGYLNLTDLGNYRAFMDELQQSGEDSTPLGDIDGDGVPNYYEFAFGSDPVASGSVPKFEPRVVTQSNDPPGGNEGFGPPSGSSNYFVLPYLRRTGGSLSGVTYTTPDAIYTPQASKDLQNWAEPIEPADAPGDLPAPPVGYEWGAVRLPTPPDADPNQKGFIRVFLSAP